MTGNGLDGRLEFMQVTTETRQALRSAQPLISEKLPAALDHFYAQVRKTPETRAHFRDDGHITKGEAAARIADMRDEGMRPENIG